jgi:hypothetical protein
MNEFRRGAWAVGIAAAIAMGTLSCGSTVVISTQASGTPVIFVRINFLSTGVQTEGQQVIADAQSWSAIWPRLNQNTNPQPALPSVDFSSETVLVATMAPASGNWVSIDSASESGDVLSVSVTETQLPNGCTLPVPPPRPADVVRVPRRDPASIEFHVTRKTSSCG